MGESIAPNICRACLTDEGEFQSVFVPDENSGLQIHLAEMIMASASVQITLGDGLPEQICLTCAEKAVHLYLFKQRCEESDRTLRRQLGKSPLSKMYSIAEEQRLAAEALNLDQYAIDVIIKPEITMEGEEQIQNKEDNAEYTTKLYETNDNASDVQQVVVESQPEIDERVSCHICKKIFNHIGNLNRHKKVHLQLKQYTCNICQKSFIRNDLLIRHQNIHKIKTEDSELIPLEAILREELIAKHVIEVKSEDIVDDLKGLPCDTIFCPKEEFSADINVHEPKTKSVGSKCSQCNKKFSKAAHLTRHMKIHADVKPYVCELCHKGFARAEQLANHKNAHSGVKPHVCSICSKGFNQISNLKDHMRTHNGEKPFLCSICGKGFNQLGNLRQHTIRHSGVKAHLCSTCGNGFASKGELCAHLRKHTGARPFVCPICNNGFTTSSSLTKHKRIHSGEKPYECEVCKMKFSRSGILARHKRTHTGEKPYVCKFCTKAFSQSNDLSSHLRIHTGEKPYICDTCGQAFRQSSALKTHKKIHIDRNIAPTMIHSSFLNVIP